MNQRLQKQMSSQRNGTTTETIEEVLKDKQVADTEGTIERRIESTGV